VRACVTFLSFGPKHDARRTLQLTAVAGKWRLQGANVSNKAEMAALAADADEEFEIVLDSGAASYRLAFDAEAYARESDDATERQIAETWDAKRQSNKRLFNATKFRLARVVDQTICVGLTDYRDYVGTHLSSSLRRDDDSLANAIGCEAVLRLSDKKIVLLRRSALVATHGGQFNGPSGHAEPSNCDLNDPESVRRELFRNAILSEIRDETGLPEDVLGDPIFLGIMRDRRRKPDFLFLVDCETDEAGFRARHDAKTHDEAWESDRLLVLPVSRISSAALLSSSCCAGEEDGVVLTPVTRALSPSFFDARRLSSKAKAAPAGKLSSLAARRRSSNSTLNNALNQ